MTWHGIPAPDGGYSAYECMECGHLITVSASLIPDMDAHVQIHTPKEEIPHDYIPGVDRSHGMEE